MAEPWVDHGVRAAEEAARQRASAEQDANSLRAEAHRSRSSGKAALAVMWLAAEVRALRLELRSDGG